MVVFALYIKRLLTFRLNVVVFHGNHRQYVKKYWTFWRQERGPSHTVVLSVGHYIFLHVVTTNVVESYIQGCRETCIDALVFVSDLYRFAGLFAHDRPVLVMAAVGALSSRKIARFAIWDVHVGYPV